MHFLFNGCGTEIEKTTSWSDGLREESQFLPCLRRPVRRTDSVDDIQKYKDYFLIAQKNQGQDFTWKNYTEILLDTLRNFDTSALISKLPSRSFLAPIKLQTSTRAKVIASESGKRKYLGDFKCTEKSFLNVDTGAESLPSVDDIASKKAIELPVQDLPIPSVKPKSANFTTVTEFESPKIQDVENYNHKVIPFPDKNKGIKRVLDDVKDVILTPSKYSLKNMCSEIRILAEKTCRSVENLATPKQCIEKIMYKKPMTRSMFKDSNFNKNQPTCSRTPERTFSETPTDRVDSYPKKLKRVSSADDVKDVTLTPSKYSLKKMCCEIRILAQKTCGSVGKLATPKQQIEKVMYKKPMTPSMLTTSNFNKNQPACSRTPVRTPSGTSMDIADLHPKKLRFTPYSSSKMTSVVKEEKKSEEV